MAIRLVIFLFLNFVALAIGGTLMGDGASSDWYLQLNKAPWTPPGWSFGVAWTVIMIGFAIYMSYAFEAVSNKPALLILFGIQWILNTSWSPLFFRYHQSMSGLLIISLLTFLVAYLLFANLPRLKAKTLFILPYFVWLLIATSLNAYIVIRN
jgi:benzodiazapine receptor